MAMIDKYVYPSYRHQIPKIILLTFANQDKARLRASLALNITVDYTSVAPAWGAQEFDADAFTEEWLGPKKLGVKAVATQHMLGAPYFTSVTDDEIVLEWQQLASHGRSIASEDLGPLGMIGEMSDGRSYMQQTFVKVEGQWRILFIRPEVIYHTEDFKAIGRRDEGEWYVYSHPVYQSNI